MSTYTYSTLDDPSANWSVTHSNGYTSNGSTNASGINNAGQIAGYYTASNGNAYGFLLSGGTYTTIDDPLATGTVPQGINDAGQIVGYYHDSQGNYFNFLDSGGTFTT